MYLFSDMFNKISDVDKRIASIAFALGVFTGLVLKTIYDKLSNVPPSKNSHSSKVQKLKPIVAKSSVSVLSKSTNVPQSKTKLQSLSISNPQPPKPAVSNIPVGTVQKNSKELNIGYFNVLPSQGIVNQTFIQSFANLVPKARGGEVSRFNLTEIQTNQPDNEVYLANSSKSLESACKKVDAFWLFTKRSGRLQPEALKKEIAVIQKTGKPFKLFVVEVNVQTQHNFADMFPDFANNCLVIQGTGEGTASIVNRSVIANKNNFTLP